MQAQDKRCTQNRHKMYIFNPLFVPEYSLCVQDCITRLPMIHVTSILFSVTSLINPFSKKAILQTYSDKLY